VIAVEADPGHFAELGPYLKEHGISLEKCTLINAPIAGVRRSVKFQSGDTKNWYGQAIISDDYARHLMTDLTQIWDRWFGRRRKVLTLNTITLAEILNGVEKVNLIDMDIQGTEADVIEYGLELLRKKVLAVHIGTHSTEIEERIRKAMTPWNKRWDFGCLGERDTPAGRIVFEDGVLSFKR